MKFALSNGQRQEAQPNLSGECPGCGRPMVARCGEARAWHWAHKGRLLCDPWWENETGWHRAWKDQFPAEWQEIVHQTKDGERHIADVKTGDGWVIEFQHSYLKPEERRSREAFYSRLIWVVDGMSRKRDRAQLMDAWHNGALCLRNSPLWKTLADDCRVLREWGGSNLPVFLDLGEGAPLLFLVTGRTSGWAYLFPVLHADFIKWHRAPATAIPHPLEGFVVELPKVIAQYESHLRTQPLRADPLQPRRSPRRPRL